MYYKAKIDKAVPVLVAGPNETSDMESTAYRLWMLCRWALLAVCFKGEIAGVGPT